MRTASLAKVLILLGAAVAPAVSAGGDTGFARMATCQDSWLDWKTSDPAKLQAFAAMIGSGYTQGEGANGQFLVPKTPQTVVGLRVTQVFPEKRRPWGVGFSVTVWMRRSTRRATSGPMTFARQEARQSCETGDGMHNVRYWTSRLSAPSRSCRETARRTTPRWSAATISTRNETDFGARPFNRAPIRIYARRAGMKRRMRSRPAVTSDTSTPTGNISMKVMGRR